MGWSGYDSVYTEMCISGLQDIMVTSSNGNSFRVTGPLCREFIGDQWIPLTKVSDTELWCFLWPAPWIKGWVNNREAGDLRHHRAHFDVIVMLTGFIGTACIDPLIMLWKTVQYLWGCTSRSWTGHMDLKGSIRASAQAIVYYGLLIQAMYCTGTEGLPTQALFWNVYRKVRASAAIGIELILPEYFSPRRIHIWTIRIIRNVTMSAV